MPKGVNTALVWEAMILHISPETACVHKWIMDTLMGKARVHTKVAREMLIRQQLCALTSLVEEYRLSVDVFLGGEGGVKM